MTVDWHPQVYEHLLAGYYQKVSEFYEQAVATEPDAISNYWYLGLAYLLQAQEEEAQATWLTPMLDADDRQISQWNYELSVILEAEAQRQEALNNLKESWLIRGHLREIDPSDINNLLNFLRLSVAVEAFTLELMQQCHVAEVLSASSPTEINSDLLSTILKQVLAIFLQQVVDLSEVTAYCEVFLNCALEPKMLIPAVTDVMHRAFYVERRADFAIALAKLCLSFQPNDILLLKNIFYFHFETGQFEAAIEYGQRYCEHCRTDLALEIAGNTMMLQALLMTGGRWSEALTRFEHQKVLLSQLTQNQELRVTHPFSLITSAFAFNYFEDNLPGNRWFQNQLSQFCQRNLALVPKQAIRVPRTRIVNNFTSRKLKVAYISHRLLTHSVGWLSRWLFQHCNHEKFETSLYLVAQPIMEFTQKWFVEKVDRTVHFEHANATLIAEKIADDKIDILVDLESITHSNICEVMALKPAPVQVTWLGADASGIPTIDYFVADPYVLPDNAQAHYREKIWRLPKTYLAVNGFEIHTPTIRREDFNVPADAIIYLSAQTGQKRNPDLARLQLKILKAVPNGYLFIKGFADNKTIQNFFSQLAEAEGVSPERLRFMHPDPSEYSHRANLQIADVVLDTYPYNGATTTLEVLWIGIPLVTRVGQQFAARNSYAFMTNAGLHEGIAWTDDEYVEWGIRFGQDEALRQQVSWKLRASRHTSPLWDAKQFTREMEAAYQQMWSEYLETSTSA